MIASTAKRHPLSIARFSFILLVAMYLEDESKEHTLNDLFDVTLDGHEIHLDSKKHAATTTGTNTIATMVKCHER